MLRNCLSTMALRNAAPRSLLGPRWAGFASTASTGATISPISQSRSDTPAAIAGLTPPPGRRVLSPQSSKRTASRGLPRRALPAHDDRVDGAVAHAISRRREARSPQGGRAFAFRSCCIDCTGASDRGAPGYDHVSTSYVERSNLSNRMGLRHFTRLTNAFSTKLENHYRALSLYFVFYKFLRIHKTLKVAPAMAVGVTDRLW